VIGIAVAIPSAPSLADTVGFRMDGDGRYPDTRPPLAWSASRNVVWKAPMPGSSNASPVFLADASLLFVLSEPDRILAVNADNGETVWTDSTADVTDKRGGAHKANGFTTPTPATDGSHVYSVFGSGVVAAHDVKGKRRWARFVQKPTHRWGHSASPVLGGGHLIVHIVDVIALNPDTGAEVWRAESRPRWGSPVVARIGGTDVVVTPAGDVFRASDGKRVASEIGSLAYATPVVQDGMIYFIEKRATAVRLPDSLEGPFETLWESRIQGSRHYASSLIHDGLVYAVSREQQFSVLDAGSGELLLERQLDLDTGSNSAYPSLALAGGKIFLSTENGATVVLQPGREYKEVGRSSIEGFRSSPIFVGNRMFVRTFEHLYCFGGPEG
jgi:outer membrane protein assembly factor BamB